MKATKFILMSLLSASLLTGCETVSNTMDDVKWPRMPDVTWPDLSFSKDKKSTPTTTSNATSSACPTITISPELSQITQFSKSSQRDATTELVTAKFDYANVNCRTSGSVAEAVLSLNFSARLGQSGIKDAKVQANYVAPYFIAVIDKNGQIVSKDVFALSLVFGKGEASINATESLRQTIPLSAATRPSDYRLMIGFQLDANDLNYNRQMNLPSVSVVTNDPPQTTQTTSLTPKPLSTPVKAKLND